MLHLGCFILEVRFGGIRDLSIYYLEAPHDLRLVRCALFGLGFSAGASVAGGGIWVDMGGIWSDL